MSNYNKQRGFTAIEVAIVVVVVAIIGALGWRLYDGVSNKSSIGNISQREDLDMQPSDLSGIVDLSTIQQTAIADKIDATVDHVELELNKDGGLVYKTQLSDGTVSVYNARTGELVKTSTDEETTSETLPTTFNGGIGFIRALELAKAEKPDSKVFKIELELEGGIIVYSVRFGDKARVDVNAEDGSIVRTKASKADKKAAKEEDKVTRKSERAVEKEAKKAAKSEAKVSERSSDSDDNSNRSASDSKSDSDDDDDSDNNDTDDDSDKRLEN